MCLRRYLYLQSSVADSAFRGRVGAKKAPRAKPGGQGRVQRVALDSNASVAFEGAPLI
jgi:hypothetical protein